jgi:hypothetical protein
VNHSIVSVFIPLPFHSKEGFAKLTRRQRQKRPLEFKLVSLFNSFKGLNDDAEIVPISALDLPHEILAQVERLSVRRVKSDDSFTEPPLVLLALLPAAKRGNLLVDFLVGHVGFTVSVINMETQLVGASLFSGIMAWMYSNPLHEQSQSLSQYVKLHTDTDPNGCHPSAIIPSTALLSSTKQDRLM